MKKLVIVLGMVLSIPALGFAQNKVRGTVYTEIEGKIEPLPGAVVQWVGQTGYVLTDSLGVFEIARQGAHMLFASFVGFQNDTLHVSTEKSQNISFVLKPQPQTLEEVVVRDQSTPSALKKRDVSVTQLITTRELTKAACCNLSESFETNPAIDASFTDAVTGTRQIRLLGLDGPYSYYTRANIPTMWGLASVLGLQLIPGSWIQSIQLTKGSGSVVNGYESMAGQVNYELRQPDMREKLYVQLYANAGGRLEQSVVYPIKISNNWATNFMLYGRQQVAKPDFNRDGFLDMPQGNLSIVQNTWKYRGNKGWESHFGLKYSDLDQTGGQIGALNAEVNDSVWQAKMRTKRFEYWHKTGYVFKNKPYRSIGLQWMYNWHDQQSSFGLPKQTPTYTGQERDLYLNLIFQDIIKSTQNQYKIGLSYKSQRIDEFFAARYLRTEQVPGAFAEYTYLPSEKVSVVAGLRADIHNIYGLFATPRLHIRYAPNAKHTFRANVGKAYRTPNLFADNMGAMASNRTWNIEKGVENLPYTGLKQEESLNAGLSYSYTFEWDYRPGSFRAEYFYTTFQNRLVKDWDAGAQQIDFYNLEGQSFVHNMQLQFDYELFKRLNARLAYRYVDAQNTYKSIGLAQQPFIAMHRLFANFDYETRTAWKFDATINWHGKQRLPTTESNAEMDRRGEMAPAFATVNLQITKVFREVLDVHIGAENVFNFRQENPIVAADDPFRSTFDASMIWGPIMGRVVYFGVRYKWL